MAIESRKQEILIEKLFDDYHIENELLQSTPYEMILINNSHDLINNLSSRCVALMTARIPLNEYVINQIPSSLKVITKVGAGYDNIDVNQLRQRNIELCYVPDYGTNTVAEHAVALLFAAQRRLINLHQSIVNMKKWSYKNAGKLTDLNTMTLGIIGCGRIGTCFADKMRPLVKTILTHNPKDLTTNTIEEIFDQSDIISLHIPLSNENYHFISSDSFAKMKRSPILINVSRGALIDTNALIYALKNGQISYAALDVIENEPNINDQLIKFDNVLLTPHSAWYSIQSEQSLRIKALQDTLRVLTGEKPLDPIPK